MTPELHEQQLAQMLPTLLLAHDADGSEVRANKDGVSQGVKAMKPSKRVGHLQPQWHPQEQQCQHQPREQVVSQGALHQQMGRVDPGRHPCHHTRVSSL